VSLLFRAFLCFSKFYLLFSLSKLEPGLIPTVVLIVSRFEFRFEFHIYQKCLKSILTVREPLIRV